ncbi:uncharacterized protein JCM6883_006208 [Sporobolomyces salmoneus]|uniref:uncharacterized protein n=1 Tax=Sporobolomyces salmoneus TaxID=183962 RepID=UPI0031756DA1
MSSRASPIPADAFERPSSPSPSVRSNCSQFSARPSSTFSPFRPIVLPSTYTHRPVVYRAGARPPPPTAFPGQPIGEVGKEDDENWETASVSSWGGDDVNENGRAFHPRLRDLRSPRPNVRKPETKEKKDGMEEKEAVREEGVAGAGETKTTVVDEGAAKQKAEAEGETTAGEVELADGGLAKTSSDEQSRGSERETQAGDEKAAVEPHRTSNSEEERK